MSIHTVFTPTPHNNKFKTISEACQRDAPAVLGGKAAGNHDPTSSACGLPKRLYAGCFRGRSSGPGASRIRGRARCSGGHGPKSINRKSVYRNYRTPTSSRLY